METLLFLIFLVLVLPGILRALAKSTKNRELAELKAQDPEAWMKLQQMEHEKEVIAHQKRLLRHEQMKTGMGAATFVARLLMKK